MAQIKNVTELDFDQIKTNLKVFLSSQDKFNDYDFDGSGMSVLLDVLAYNTQYNALLAHMSMNEAFLDSSQIRQNTVSHAKGLGYIPKSVVAAKATLDVTVTGTAESAAELTIPKGTKFSGQVGSTPLEYVTNTSFIAAKNSFNNQYAFKNVVVCEGKLNTIVYRVDNKEKFQKFRISDAKIDTSTMLVRVRDSLTSSDYTTYTHYTSILDVSSASKVYFIQENNDGFFEIYFGDGVLGFKPTTGQLAEVTYISSNGEAGNGAKVFSSSSTIGGLSSIAVALASGFTKTISGTSKESIESIKFNAPKLFAAQDRAVTSEDYRSILLANYDFIKSISVWGGETAVPPVYGKVYISIKPTTDEVLTDFTKNSIIQFMSDKNVGSVTPEIVDPDFTFLKLQVFFKYDSGATALTTTQLASAIRATITTYNDTVLGKFDGVFRQSNILANIDNTDVGIINSVINTTMFKKITPSTGVSSNYTINFAVPIEITETTAETLSSDTFTVGTVEVKLGDVLVGDGTNDRTVQLKNATTGAIVNSNIGTLCPEKGLLEITSLNIASTSVIKIFAKPNSVDVSPKFNQLVSIALDESNGVTVTGQIDSIAELGSSGSSNYTTFSRSY